MVIDIPFQTRKATELESFCLKHRELLHFYKVESCDGSDASVLWSETEIAAFCPSRTVSEMLIRWEQSVCRQIQLYQEAIDTEQHSYWKVKERKYHPVVKNSWEYTGREVPDILTASQAELYQREIKRLETRVGPYQFIKIII